MKAALNELSRRVLVFFLGLLIAPLYVTFRFIYWIYSMGNDTITVWRRKIR